MTSKDPNFLLRFADNSEDLAAAQRLRYAVFVAELGAAGADVDHLNQLEKDRFDPFFDHLLLFDQNRAAHDQVVGAYRLQRLDQAENAGGFYSAREYDLTPLLRSGRRLLELGRSCVHPDYRGGTAMFELWSGLARYIAEQRIEVMFGVASFSGTDIAALAEPLSYLHHHHLAPPDLRVAALADHAQAMDLLPVLSVDRRRAMVKTPALIKAYLRLGGFVGQGAWVDHAFNTTDVCLIMDTNRMNARQRKLYSKDAVTAGAG